MALCLVRFGLARARGGEFSGSRVWHRAEAGPRPAHPWGAHLPSLPSLLPGFPSPSGLLPTIPSPCVAPSHTLHLYSSLMSVTFPSPLLPFAADSCPSPSPFPSPPPHLDARWAHIGHRPHPGQAVADAADQLSRHPAVQIFHLSPSSPLILAATPSRPLPPRICRPRFSLSHLTPAPHLPPPSPTPWSALGSCRSPSSPSCNPHSPLTSPPVDSAAPTLTSFPNLAPHFPLSPAPSPLHLDLLWVLVTTPTSFPYRFWPRMPPSPMTSLPHTLMRSGLM